MFNSIKTYIKKNFKISITLFITLFLILMYIMFFYDIKDKFDNIELNKPIFRIFDIDLTSDTWDYHLDNVVKANGTYILINPIQPVLNNTTEWWNKYQPLDFNIPETTKMNLEILCLKASSKGINVIVDVVWNHTNMIKYTDETRHLYKDKKINSNNTELSKEEFQDVWISTELPKLNNKLKKLKEKALNAIETYRICGVKGFRIDSANHIDEDFFDYIFKNSPKDELHIYEIWVIDYSPYSNMMINRIRNDNCEVIFYDYKPFTEINNLVDKIVENKGKRTTQSFPPSDHLMNSMLDQDLIIQFNKDKPLYLYMYFILSIFIQNDKYFVYSIFSTQGNTDNVLIQHLLFNWDNYFKNVQSILDIKKNLPKVIGQIECFTTEYNNNNIPILVGSVGKNCKMLINLTNNEDNKIPCKYLFNNSYSNLNLKNLITNKPVNNENIKDEYIILPTNSYTIIQNDVKIKNKKINIIMFWYQGLDQASEIAKKTIKIWKEYKNGNIIFLDRINISNYLSSDEMKTIEFLEQKIPPPYLYAAVSDLIRWIVLKKIGGGIYLDCDIFPTSTTIYLLNCYYEYDSVILGKEGSSHINNAVIIANPNAISIINIICDHMIYNIYHNKVEKTTFHNTYYNAYYNGENNTNPYFNWILMNTGPIFIKNLIENGNNIDTSKIIIFDSLWMYSSWSSSEKTQTENCGNNLGLIQHCYAGEWTK